MQEHVQNDPTDAATKRPDSPPLKRAGSAFVPMNIPDFPYDIRLPADASYDDPISLFQLYYSLEIIQQLVDYTNNYIREPKDPTKPHCRASNWYPTCTAELYIFLGIRIYMTLNVQNEISDYWDTRRCSPSHFITSCMPRDRFQELHMRFRWYDPGADGPYEKVYKNSL
jgi:hypothetical protein